MRALASHDSLTFSHCAASFGVSSLTAAGANCFRVTFPFELFASISMYQPRNAHPLWGRCCRKKRSLGSLHKLVAWRKALTPPQACKRANGKISSEFSDLRQNIFRKTAGNFAVLPKLNLACDGGAWREKSAGRRFHGKADLKNARAYRCLEYQNGRMR